MKWKNIDKIDVYDHSVNEIDRQEKRGRREKIVFREYCDDFAYLTGNPQDSSPLPLSFRNEENVIFDDVLQMEQSNEFDVLQENVCKSKRIPKKHENKP